VIPDEKKQVLDLFAQGRKFYKLTKFPDARDAFAKALKIDPDDGPSKVFYARCKYYIEHPPSDDWDGVSNLTTK